MDFLKWAAFVSLSLVAAHACDAQSATVADLKGRWMIADTSEAKVSVHFGTDSAMRFEVLAAGMPAVRMEGKYWLEFKSQLNLVHFEINGESGRQRTCQILKLHGDTQIQLQDASCTAPDWKSDPEATEVFRLVER